MMRLLLVLAGVVALGGCNSSPTPLAPGQAVGRYSGIGVFDAGRLWSQAKGSPSSNDASVAQLADDEHIIVVLDSHTGEVRQCGDHSGHCVGMNPWSVAAGSVPVSLQRHMADLAADDRDAAALRSGKQATVNN